jgi:hypothetical protein
MSILYKLASSLGRRDAEPNQKLAQQIIIRMDTLSIIELIENTANKIENTQADCIEVLSEIAKYKPELVVEYDTFFIQLLSSKNRNLVLGTLSVLDYITHLSPHIINKNLAEIMEVADNGVLISKEHGISILLQLISTEKYAQKAFSLFLVQIRTCAVNLVVKYAEKAAGLIGDTYKAEFVKVLNLRMGEVENDIKRDKIMKVIRVCEIA